MKRTIRWLYGITGALSLVLILSSTVMWVRSYWKGDLYCYINDTRFKNGSRSDLPWPSGFDADAEHTKIYFYSGQGCISIMYDWYGDWQSINAYQMTLSGWLPIDSYGITYQPPNNGSHVGPLNSLWASHFGFYYTSSKQTAARRSWRLRVPWWSITLLTLILPAIPPAIWIRRIICRRRRKKYGWCLSCGYDLTGSADKCPECGHASDPEATKA